MDLGLFHYLIKMGLSLPSLEGCSLFPRQWAFSAFVPSPDCGMELSHGGGQSCGLVNLTCLVPAWWWHPRQDPSKLPPAPPPPPCLAKVTLQELITLGCLSPLAFLSQWYEPVIGN